LDNMTCGGCVRSVTRATQSVDADAGVVADPAARLVEVQTSATRERIIAALREAGFPPREQREILTGCRSAWQPVRRTIRRRWPCRRAYDEPPHRCVSRWRQGHRPAAAARPGSGNPVVHPPRSN